MQALSGASISVRALSQTHTLTHMHINVSSQGWQALCFEFSLFLLSLQHSGRHILTNSCPVTSSWHSHEFECHVFLPFFRMSFLLSLHFNSLHIFTNIKWSNFGLLSPPPCSISAPAFSSPSYLCSPHFSSWCLVLYLPFSIHLTLLCLSVPLPSIVLFCISHLPLCPDTSRTSVPGTNARIDPVCDHLGRHCHLFGVSSHLHLNLLLPARPADRPQHYSQESLHQPLCCWATLPHRYWQDGIPCELI